MNLTSQGEPWVNGVDAATSFVASTAVLMDEAAGVEIIYSGLDAADAYVKLQGGNSADITRARDLTDFVTTMTTANSSILFNVSKIGFNYMYLVYDAGTNSKGTITAHLSRKQKS